MSNNIQTNTTGRLTPCLQQKIDKTRYLVEVHFSNTSNQNEEDKLKRVILHDLEESQVSFKELEQKIFAYVCELGREITKIMLESYDRELAEGRDKKNYRCKGKRKTTIKTVYGEVEYNRCVYRTMTEGVILKCIRQRRAMNGASE